ncbi:hypothetical protein POX_g09297 [Penicillium oxalicum]|uniref:hypothetical protein n=1 Tax=Penicillium oxalicum TaxID=69781 RepID=UPI0020B89ACE|nr:hypothetical protein POX_g09297 [Penicillium oxalicum]KAI2786901.1 hypothetical protein POX_g09297 [Penicillium oxalicum]
MSHEVTTPKVKSQTQKHGNLSNATTNCCAEDAMELVLGHHWPSAEDVLKPAPGIHTDLLKAAWALTILCFQPEDVISMSYVDPWMPVSQSPLILSVRVNPAWDIKSLVESFQSAGASNSARTTDSYGVRTAKLGQLSDASTAGLIYYGASKQQLVYPKVNEMGMQLAVFERDKKLFARITATARTITSSPTVNSLLRTFQHILHQITTESMRKPLKQIDYCSEFHIEEIRKLTQTRSTYNSVCLHDLILDNCRKYPTKLAVRSFDGDLTYEALERFSRILAHYLVDLGLRPEGFVLSSFQKSTWAIVARLAILRAGGAYISIHSSNPPAYLDSVIQRTDARIMLSDASYAHRFYGIVERVITITPSFLESLLPRRFSNNLPRIDSSGACTVLFTSGSTGRPKAIVQEHRSYASAIRDYTRNLDLGPETRFLHFDEYAFDISNLEFLVPLIVGGCCCVPGPMISLQDLANNIQILEANIAFLTPTVAIKANPESMKSLKILCVGGEPLPKDLLNNWSSSSTKLINQYGMGEAAVCCAFNDNVHSENSSPATIGKPSSGAIWIIDPTDPEKLVPVGAIGEVVIEGPHLARGYLDQSHESSDRTKPAGFMERIPSWLRRLHPDRESPRLYRSGDLARWTSDGRIEYIGRKDTIVKLDGCRIDIVEVEHLARKCLGPKDAIVIDLLGAIDGKDDPCLAAFMFLNSHPENSELGEIGIKDACEDQHAMQKITQIKEALAVILD